MRCPNRRREKLASKLPLDELLTHSEAVPPYFDEPKVWIFTGRLRLNSGNDLVNLEDQRQAEYGYSGSASLRLHQALLALLGESAERYALLPRKTSSDLKSYYDISAEDALDPGRVVAGLKHRSPDRSELAFRWVTGNRYSDGSPIQIPLQLIEVPYIFTSAETILRAPITTGAAAGTSLEDCVLGGLLEIIERDAFMLAWLLRKNLGRLARLSEETEDGRELKILIRECERYKLTVMLRVVPSDFPVVVVAAFLFDDSHSDAPFLTVGASAAFTAEEAALKALLEALQLRSWLRSDPGYSHKTSEEIDQIPTQVRTINERANLLFNDQYCGMVRSWIESEMVTIELPDAATRPLDLAKSIEEQGGTVLVVDLSQRLPAKVRDAGFQVVKVVVPEMQPLYLNDYAQDVAWDRIRVSSTEYGGSKEWPDLNPIPHPFL